MKTLPCLFPLLFLLLGGGSLASDSADSSASASGARPSLRENLSIIAGGNLTMIDLGDLPAIGMGGRLGAGYSFHRINVHGFFEFCGIEHGAFGPNCSESTRLICVTAGYKAFALNPFVLAGAGSGRFGIQFANSTGNFSKDTTVYCFGAGIKYLIFSLSARYYGPPVEIKVDLGGFPTTQAVYSGMNYGFALVLGLTLEVNLLGRYIF